MNETQNKTCPNCPECGSSNTEHAFTLFSVENFLCKDCESLFGERVTKISQYEYSYQKGPNDPSYK